MAQHLSCWAVVGKKAGAMQQRFKSPQMPGALGRQNHKCQNAQPQAAKNLRETGYTTSMPSSLTHDAAPLWYVNLGRQLF
mmetsp:Transcript_61833/g.119129  ORF Transcript_61833/g.119129 Transcript_61833/m.119129 type:complete len:80 (+) Transcript_61833:2826-3065(+)